ncbi:MAG: hypothetical protein JSR17_09035 [Proteobacteria bacterium]|nr:hypothetical protein [Pseudomonadota bacterium]
MKLSAVEYMINYLVKQRSFALGYPMEASSIAQESDYFLTSCLGNTLKLIAIIDCSLHPLKRITFSEDELHALRLSLREFSYHAYGKRLSTSIEIWYIGNHVGGILTEPAIALTDVTKYKFWVSSWGFDLDSHDVVCNSFSIRNWVRKRVLSKVFKHVIAKDKKSIFPLSSFSFEQRPRLI